MLSVVCLHFVFIFCNIKFFIQLYIDKIKKILICSIFHPCMRSCTTISCLSFFSTSSRLWFTTVYSFSFLSTAIATHIFNHSGISLFLLSFFIFLGLIYFSQLSFTQYLYSHQQVTSIFHLFYIFVSFHHPFHIYCNCSLSLAFSISFSFFHCISPYMP